MDVEDKQKNTALHIAARHGHASVTKTLACNGANLMRRGARGMLPVHMACLSGYSDCVETLIPISKWEGPLEWEGLISLLWRGPLIYRV